MRKNALMTATVPVLTTLTMQNFDHFVKARDFALIEVKKTYLSMDLDVLKGAAQYLDGAYPERFSFGVLDPESISVDRWWRTHFPSSFLNTSGRASGFHLFGGRGKGVHCPKPIGIRSPDATEAVVTLLAIALGGTGGHSDERKMNWVVEDVCAYIAAFDEVVATTAPSSTEDPFSVLGVEKNATPEEITKAYKKQMVANAPDKVAQMSPVIQAVATAQAKKINAAYAAIKKMQGW